MQNIKWLYLYCKKYGLRWLLCCLSMAIAVVCMCLISYISYVVQNALLEQVSLMGTDLLMGYLDRTDGLLDTFVEDIEQYGKVDRYSFVGSDIFYFEQNVYDLKFVENSYFDLYQMEIGSGRLFYDFEDEHVVVVGKDLANTFRLHDRILYHNQWYTVIGILDSVSESFYGNDNTCVFIPYRFYDSSHTQLLMKSTDEVFTKQYLSYYLDMYAIEYEIFSQSQIKEAMKLLLELMEKVLYIIGCVSFVVSMLGIGNVMLFSVEQRKSEIGIRKSIGASDFAIFLQFLLEVCVMSVVGYVIGMVLSILCILVFSWYLDSYFYLTSTMSLYLLLMCLGIGIVGGVVPAYLACKKDVVDVLSV